MTPTIGIIAGSGPDAGIDLWTKVLAAARRSLGDAYRGDADAPRVEVVSEPRLGASMNLPATHAEVWATLESTARSLAPRCDVYAIACNTLNVYAPELASLGLGAELVSFPDAVADWAKRNRVSDLGLLGAAPVADLGEWSPYRGLARRIRVEPPADLDALHALITAVKADGGADPRHRDRLAGIAEGFRSETLLLACTELPLVAGPVAGHHLVDVTEIVAEALVRRWMAIGAG